MYKAKLQELSQQKRWGLPRYTSMKDGEDHLPHFKASVHVNGLSFHSPTISTSSKQAHDLAAKLAFLHFSSSSGSESSESQSSALPVANCSLKPIDQHDAGGSNIGERYSSTKNHAHALDVKDDQVCPGSSTPRGEKPETRETNHNMETDLHASSVSNGECLQDLQYQYKSPLQNYARSKNLDVPLYSSKRDGPPHALRFKATVTIDGYTYESPEFYNTLKKAEHAAAKVALMSLLQDDFQEEDSGFYKNVLLELAQKELFCIPTYETVKCGPSHMPTFFSTVEVDGEIFHGKAGKSKKQAEMKAANVAYAAFMDRALRRRADFTPTDSQAHEVLNSLATSVQVMTVDSQQNLKPPQLPFLSPPTIGHKEHAEEMKVALIPRAKLTFPDSSAGEVFNYSSSIDQVISAESEIYVIPECSALSSLPVSYEEHAKESKNEVQEVDSADILSASVMLDIDKMNTKKIPVAHKEDSASSTEEIENMSYLLCGRVRVYPFFPDVSFPKGITVLPISEDKWVAISLEFPHEIGN